MTRTEARFAHVIALTDDIGIFEHAALRVPRTEHGYCVDDVARALIAVCRDELAFAVDSDDRVVAPDVLTRLEGVYLRFIEQAQACDGRIVNRCDVHGNRNGAATVEDCWGRSLWALGTAASRSRDAAIARRAAERFVLGAARRSPWPRAMAFAGLGAAEVLRVDPGNGTARALLADAAAAVGEFRRDQPWPWPEPRLTYANAVLADVLLAAGDSLHDDRLVARGLQMLAWLVELQTGPDHLSLTPAAGWVTGEPWPGFDQQPIEAATLADACARAFDLTADARWAHVVELAEAWFHGRNDSGTSLLGPVSGGCCDGLEPHGRNENQGAESTLALVTTVQHATRLAGSRS
jgi:hypothetical protein